MRASEAEREAVVAQLRDHAAEGRLDADELEARVEAAFSARFREQLDELLGDLPAPSAPGGNGFDAHFRVFVLVQLMLVAIWALTGLGYFWPVWPLMGWGIGIVVHRICEPGRHPVWASASRKGLRRRATAS